MNDPGADSEHGSRPREHGPWRTLFSVLAAFFGVQSSANYERDDKYGNMGYFVLFGLLVTLVLVGAIMLFVKILIAQAG